MHACSVARKQSPDEQPEGCIYATNVSTICNQEVAQTMPTPNEIKKTLDLNSPPAKVWKALTDHEQFGAWFRVKLEAPFQLGKQARGRITHPGYEHVEWKATVVAMEPEKRFAFTWQPYAIDP